MATKKAPKNRPNKTAVATGRPKPLVHPPGLTSTRRRFGCGGKLKTKTS